MALDVDALWVVPSFFFVFFFVFFFFFCFLLMCYRALLCFALLFLLFTINFIHYPILLYTCALEIFAFKTT